MKKKNYILFIILFVGILGAQTNIPSIVTKVATATGNWLKLETSARAIGMGGAQVAIGDGVAASAYNPASIAFLKGSNAYYSKSNYLAGITHNVIAYGTRLSRTDYVGFHLFYLDSGPMNVTTLYFPDGTGEEYSVLSLAFRMTYARVLSDRLRFGMTLKYVREQIYTTHMQSFVIDLGSNFDTGIYGFSLGMSVNNFGPEVQYQGEGLQVNVPADESIDSTLAKVTQKFSLPLSFRLGIKNDIVGPESEFYKSNIHRLTVAADGVNPIDYTVTGSLGVEYAWMEMAFIRMGYHFGHDTAGLSMGGGVQIKSGSTSFGVDYAFVNYGILEYTHQFGLNFNF